jgi:glycosyltransferase involved in cell wall biosynthesis
MSSIPQRDNIEVLIIDDASDAQTKKKLKEIESGWRQVTLFENKDDTSKGAGWARNLGISRSSGEYVVFADSDDSFTDDAFQVFDDITEKEKHDFVVFKASSIKSNGRKSDRTAFRNFLVEEAARVKRSKKISVKEILSKIDAPWAKLVRREMLVKNDIKFDEIYSSEDVMFNLRVLIHSQNIKVCSEEVYIVLDHSSSLTKIRSESMLEDRFGACIRFNNEFSRHKFSGNSYSVTGGYVLEAKKYGLNKMLELTRRSFKNNVKLIYPLRRYLWALILKLFGVSPLKIRFYVAFGYKI